MGLTGDFISNYIFPIHTGCAYHFRKYLIHGWERRCISYLFQGKLVNLLPSSNVRRSTVIPSGDICSPKVLSCLEISRPYTFFFSYSVSILHCTSYDLPAFCWQKVISHKWPHLYRIHLEFCSHLVLTPTTCLEFRSIQ